MMRRFQPAGSALVIVTLVMTTVALLVLTTSRSVQDASRLSLRTDSSQLAYQRAQAALEEGILRLNQGGLIANEYGNGASVNGPTTTYSLKPMRRGADISSKDCTDLGTDGLASDAATIYSHDCGYADLSLRSTVALSASAAFPGQTLHDFDVRLFPVGVEVCQFLDVLKTAPFTISPTFTGGPGVLAFTAYDNIDCTGSALVPAYAAIPSAGIGTVSGAIKSMKIQVVSGQLSRLRLTATAITPPRQLVFEKGEQTIEAIGYEGGVRRSLLMTIRPHDTLNAGNPSKTIEEFARRFDDQGNLR